jgi:hypothetical protein
LCALQDDRRCDRLASDPHDIDTAATAPGQLARHRPHEARRSDIPDQGRAPPRASLKNQKFLNRVAHGARLLRPLDPNLAAFAQPLPQAVRPDPWAGSVESLSG